MDSNAWGLESEALGAGAVRIVGLAQRRGAAEDFAARSFLCKLAERGLIELPPVREYKRSGAQTLGWVKGDFEHPNGLDWLESFVELGPFRGTCYQAANWRCVGQTRGRSRYDRDRTLSVPPKAVYLYRL